MKINYKILKSNEGFTLVEMIVSIAIIAILSGIFMANYHLYGVKGNLNMAAQKLASDIRQAQSYSLGLKQFGSSYNNNGWGVYVIKSADNYSIFFDVDGDKIRTAPAEDYLTVKLPNRVTIENIILDGADNNSMHLVIMPPDPTISLCSDATNCNFNSAEIVLKNNDGATVSVIANIFGLVDVEN